MTPDQIRTKNLDTSILSVSGWRKIFAVDQQENSLVNKISEADQEFIIVAGYVLSSFFDSQKNGLIVVGHDSRPTSQTIAKILVQSLLAYQTKVKYIGLTSVPQTMAYTKKLIKAVGFIYVTASHNPPGYNGFKIGNQNGEVIDNNQAEKLIKQFKSTYLNNKKVLATVSTYNNANNNIQAVYQKQKANYLQSSQYYYQLILKTITGPASTSSQKIITSLKKSLTNKDVCIAYDYNGSSRLRSIDQQILKDFNVNVIPHNTKPGCFAHQIAPENKGLVDLKKLLIKRRQKNINFGITFDCDGDRGNLVLYKNSQKKQLLIPDAQFSFILAVLAELAFTEIFYPQKLKSTVIVANGPTSMRVDQICQKFSVRLFRAEVGEANVVNLGKQLRKKGYYVPIVGEGSNGGTIIHPSTVRDPLCTIFSLLKLLYLKNPGKKISLLQCVLEKYKKNSSAEFKAQDYLQLLWDLNQHYTTTSVFDPKAILKVRTKNQKKLKYNYERIFQAEYAKKQKHLSKTYNIDSWQFINYEGARTRIGAGNRGGQENGGFKVMLYSKNKEKFGYLWMRGSKTEPVFRVMVDIKGGKKTHDFFLVWHRSMLKKADL